MKLPRTKDIRCVVEDCENFASEGEYCWTHARRRRRKRPMSAAVRPKGGERYARVRRAAIQLAEDLAEPPPRGIDAATAERRADQRFYMALYRYMVTSRSEVKFFTRDGKPLKIPRR